MPKDPINPLDALFAGAQERVESLQGIVGANEEFQNEVARSLRKNEAIAAILKPYADAANATTGLSGGIVKVPSEKLIDPRAGARLNPGYTRLWIRIAFNPEMDRVLAAAAQEHGGFSQFSLRPKGDVTLQLTVNPGHTINLKILGLQGYKDGVNINASQGVNLSSGDDITEADRVLINRALATMLSTLGEHAPLCARDFAGHYERAQKGQLTQAGKAISGPPDVIALPGPVLTLSAPKRDRQEKDGVDLRGQWVAANSPVIVNRFGQTYKAVVAPGRAHKDGEMWVQYKDLPKGYEANVNYSVSKENVTLPEANASL